MVDLGENGRLGNYATAYDKYILCRHLSSKCRDYISLFDAPPPLDIIPAGSFQDRPPTICNLLLVHEQDIKVVISSARSTAGVDLEFTSARYRSKSS
jgi:hypothetical protein